jgi:hypothetical protein
MVSSKTQFRGALSAALLGAAVLAGCAGATTPPAIVQPLTVAASAPIHIVQVDVDSAPGVFLPNDHRIAIRDMIRKNLDAQSQGVAGATPESSYKMKVTLTRFDEGSAAARLALIGLGQIRIEGSVNLFDPSGQAAGMYNITKQFAVGGVVGGITTTEQVEEGFAKSVVAGLAPAKP